MPKIIKLQNIVRKGYDRMTGKPLEDFTEEFVCEGCRHLVTKTDKFCQFCGKELKSSKLIEHYFKGKQLTNEEYGTKRKQR